MDLYREIILDHYHDPRNKGHLVHAERTGDVTNTTCGDRLVLELHLDEQGKITDIAFDGDGCAISQASASLVTEEMKGKTLEEIAQIGREDVLRLLGGPVSPGRENCALLILRAKEKALANE